jgi:hypothetical protein
MKQLSILAVTALACLFSCGASLGQTPCLTPKPVACPTPPPVSSRPSCPKVGDIKGKWDLWAAGTCLRGANVWQKRVTCKHGMGPGPVGPPYDEERDFHKLAAWGANYVNISHPGVLAEQPGYPFDEGVYQNLERLITLAGRANLFVVVSFRTGPLRNEAVFDESEGPALKDVWECADVREQAWVRMWEEAAHRLMKHKNVVGYDLMVEPETKEHDLWNEMAGRIARAVRRVDPDTPIIIGGADWSHVWSLAHLKLSDVPRTLYAAHQYAPSDYTHQEDEDQGYKKGDPKKLAARLDEVYSEIEKFRAGAGKERPVVAVNEFGLHRYAPNADCFMRYQFELLERAGINHALWLWETSSPLITYDQFNFRRGTDPKNKTDCESGALVDAIKANWRLNTVRFNDVKDRF